MHDGTKIELIDHLANNNLDKVRNILGKMNYEEIVTIYFSEYMHSLLFHLVETGDTAKLKCLVELCPDKDLLYKLFDNSHGTEIPVNGNNYLEWSLFRLTIDSKTFM